MVDSGTSIHWLWPMDADAKRDENKAVDTSTRKKTVQIQCGSATLQCKKRTCSRQKGNGKFVQTRYLEAAASHQRAVVLFDCLPMECECMRVVASAPLQLPNVAETGLRRDSFEQSEGDGGVASAMRTDE